jgi:hypothetical protein
MKDKGLRVEFGNNARESVPYCNGERWSDVLVFNVEFKAHDTGTRANMLRAVVSSEFGSDFVLEGYLKADKGLPPGCHRFYLAVDPEGVFVHCKIAGQLFHPSGFSVHSRVNLDHVLVTISGHWDDQPGEYAHVEGKYLKESE